MHVELAQYDNVVHQIYEAALEPKSWPDVIQSVSELLDSSRGLMFTYAHTPAQGGFTFTHNMTQASLEKWAAKSIHEDPWVRSAGAQGYLVEGKVSLDSDLVSEADLVKTDFYREILEPMGIAKVTSGIIFDATDAHKLPTALSLYRGLADRPFNREDAEIHTRLLAHLSRSLGVMFNLRDSEMRAAASLGALDRLHCGVVLLDHCGRVTFTNKAAQVLLARGDTLAIENSAAAESLRLRLHHRLSALDKQFRVAIAQALQPLTQDATGFSEALLLPASDGRPACVVHAAPLASSHTFTTGADPAKAIVFLYDLQSASRVEPQLLGSLFNMTIAEAKAAIEMTKGGSIEEMASRLNVSPNTFKTQLQAAYSKSGTHRQADLLKLLLALASH